MVHCILRYIESLFCDLVTSQHFGDPRCDPWLPDRVEGQAIATVCTKVSQFWSSDPEVWLLISKRSSPHGDIWTKFDHIVASLSTELATEIRDGKTTPFTTEIWTHICSCHNVFHLSSVQIVLIPACCLNVCALRWYVKCLYRHLFLEDIFKHTGSLKKK